MLIEQSAQANRWRPVCPQAKALFALAGCVAAYLAASPAAALLLALLMVALVVGGARVPLWRYLRVLAAPLAFLALGGGRFEPREMVTGATVGERVEIRSRLRPGEEVVTRVNFLVDSLSRLQAALAQAGSGSRKR